MKEQIVHTSLTQALRLTVEDYIALAELERRMTPFPKFKGRLNLKGEDGRDTTDTTGNNDST